MDVYWGRAPSRAWLALRIIIDTNFTHIDLDGDGNPDLIRTLDAEGNVLESVFRDPWSDDGMLQKTVSNTERTVTFQTWTRSGKEILGIESRYLPRSDGQRTLDTHTTTEGDFRTQAKYL